MYATLLFTRLFVDNNKTYVPKHMFVKTLDLKLEVCYSISAKKLGRSHEN